MHLDKQLTAAVGELFLAGTETTSTTLRWALALMAAHPDIQSKVQKEINSNVGHGNSPSLSDRSKLSYVEACIMETQRYANLVALTMRETIQNVSVCGYSIPAETAVICNLWAVHNNPIIFPNPDEFKPERFLDDEGKIDKIKADTLIPFGAGEDKPII